MPIIAPPITDIHKASNNNMTMSGLEANIRTVPKKPLRPPPALPHNCAANKSELHARQTNVESSALVMPKNTPQKRLHESVVNDIRLNGSASKGPTSSAGHNISRGSTLKLILPACKVYSAFNIRQMSKLSMRAHHIHLLLYLEALGVSVRTSCHDGLFVPSWSQDGCTAGAGMRGRAIGSVAGASARDTPSGCRSLNTFSSSCRFPGTARNRVTELRTGLDVLAN